MLSEEEPKVKRFGSRSLSSSRGLFSLLLLTQCLIAQPLAVEAQVQETEPQQMKPQEVKTDGVLPQTQPLQTDGALPQAGVASPPQESPNYALNSKTRREAQYEQIKQGYISVRDKAKSLIKKGSYQDALDIWNAYLDTQGDHPLVHCRGMILRGYVFACMGEFEKALTDFDYGIKFAPRLPPVLMNYCFFWRGRVLVRLGRLDEAVTSYAMAQVHNQNPVLIRYILNGRANCLTKLGRFEEAMIEYGKLEELDELEGKNKNVSHEPQSAPSSVAAVASKNFTTAPSTKNNPLVKLAISTKVNKAKKPVAPTVKPIAIASVNPSRREKPISASGSSLPTRKRGGFDEEFLGDIIISDKSKEIDEYSGLLCQGDGDAESYYGRGIAFLCLGKYRAAALDFKRYVERVDWQGQAPYHAVVFCRLADLLSGRPELSSVLLYQANSRIAGSSPIYNALRYLKDSSKEKQLISTSSSVSAMTRARCILGIVALARGKRALSQQHLAWVQSNGDKRLDEYLISVSLLKREMAL